MPQEVGTLGHLLSEGRKTVKIQGQDIKVKAKISQIDIYSGHANGDELVDWVMARRPVRQGLFLTHGTKSKALALHQSLIAGGFSDCEVIIPSIDDNVDLHRVSKGAIFNKAYPRIPSEFIGHLDWHNDLAQLQIDLRRKFEQAADDRSRKILLRHLRKVLDDEKYKTV